MVRSCPVIPPWGWSRIPAPRVSQAYTLSWGSRAVASTKSTQASHFTAPRSPPNTAGFTHQKYLIYTSACFPVSPPKQPPVKCIIVSFSMKEKLFLSLTGSQLLQTRAISHARGNEWPHTTSTAAEAPGRSYTILHRVTCCPTAGAFPGGVFVVCFHFACAFFVRFWFGFVKTVLLFKSLHYHAWRD